MMKALLLCLVLLHVAPFAAADTVPLPTPRAVAVFRPPSNEYVSYTIMLLDDVLYSVDDSRMNLMAIDVAGVWNGKASYNTTVVPYPTEVFNTGTYGWVTDGEVAHPVFLTGYAIDVRERMAPKFYTSPDAETYDALCLTERNGTKYAVRPYMGVNHSEIWFVDVRAPTVPVGSVSLGGTEFDQGFAYPRCTEELLLASPLMVDIRDVTAPKLLGLLPGSTSPKQTIEDVAIDAKRKLLFTWVAPDLLTYNISNPSRPVLLSKYELKYLNITSVQCEQSTSVPAAVSGQRDNGYHVRLVDDVVYMANRRGVMMVSVKSPTQPVNFATAYFSGGAGSFHVHKVNGTVYGVYAEVLGHVCVLALHNEGA